MHLVSKFIPFVEALLNPQMLDPDPNMTTEIYDRTWEMNEELGLNDMKVEGYEEDAADSEEAKKDDVPS